MISTREDLPLTLFDFVSAPALFFDCLLSLVFLCPLPVPWFLLSCLALVFALAFAFSFFLSPVFLLVPAHALVLSLAIALSEKMKSQWKRSEIEMKSKCKQSEIEDVSK